MLALHLFKGSQSYWRLRRLKSFVPHHVLIMIYKSLIQPHFDYCMQQCLGRVSHKNLGNYKIEPLVFISGSDFNIRSREILFDLDLSKLEERRNQHLNV